MAAQRPRISLHLAAAVIAALSLGLSTPAAQADSPEPMPPTGAGKPGNNRALEVFNKTDLDRDGKLSKDEAKALPAISEQFTKLDRDGDGFLSAEEFLQAFRAEA